jgi:hypothetical protein
MAEIAIAKEGLGFTEAIPLRKIGRLERLIGPESYRVVVALLRTPVSVMGFALVGFFIVVALAAPILELVLVEVKIHVARERPRRRIGRRFPGRLGLGPAGQPQ